MGAARHRPPPALSIPLPLRRGRPGAAGSRPTAAASPLLLVVHGRAGGMVPTELQALAAELAVRRGTPVRLQVLTAGEAGEPPPQGADGSPLLLVPLLLFPGGHVRRDVPAIAAHWRRRGVQLRRLPFLGAWPGWLAALAAEVRRLENTESRPVRLLHHPLEGALAARYLHRLETLTGAACLATPYSSPDLEERTLALSGPVLPLALAANRLTERLGDGPGGPLLSRPPLRRRLLALLESLP